MMLVPFKNYITLISDTVNEYYAHIFTTIYPFDIFFNVFIGNIFSDAGPVYSAGRVRGESKKE